MLVSLRHNRNARYRSSWSFMTHTSCPLNSALKHKAHSLSTDGAKVPGQSDQFSSSIQPFNLAHVAHRLMIFSVNVARSIGLPFSMVFDARASMNDLCVNRE